MLIWAYNLVKSILLEFPYLLFYNLANKIESLIMEELHPVQMQILRELVFNPDAKFSQLNISGVSNDHFSYHIRVLQEKMLIVKSEEGYCLSEKGKIYSTKIDTSSMKLEKQPKVSVLVSAVLKKSKRKYYAIQQRLKEPYYGYYGFITGKVKWGETIDEAALRELDEEMGLTGKPKLSFILHEMVYKKDGEMLEDKYFHCVTVEVSDDTLVTKGEGCENSWFTKTGFMNLDPKYHSEEKIFRWFEKFDDVQFIEEKYYIEEF